MVICDQDKGLKLADGRSVAGTLLHLSVSMLAGWGVAQLISRWAYHLPGWVLYTDISPHLPVCSKPAIEAHPFELIQVSPGYKDV